MARTTEEVLTALRRIIPQPYWSDQSLMGGMAAVFGVVESVIDMLHDRGLWEGAEGEWLDLHALGWEVRRADGETDASLRVRLRTYPEQVVPASVLGVVVPLIQQVDPDADPPRLMEHWDDGAFCGQAHCDHEDARIGSVNGAFSVVIPDIYGDPYDTRYAALVSAVEGVRPHGARWFLVIDLEPAPVGDPS